MCCCAISASQKVKILHGGFAAWVKASLPTTTDIPKPQPKKFAIDPKSASILVDLQAMKAAVADPNQIKLDTRDVDEWIADSSSPYGKDFCPARAASRARYGSNGTA